MFILVVVNCQHDFLQNGAFPIPGMEETVNKIKLFVEKNNRLISDFYEVLDSHTEKHFSFTTNGGKFPPHCINYTSGKKSCFSEGFNAINDSTRLKCGMWTKIFKGGQSDNEAMCEEYGIHEFKVYRGWSNYDVIVCGNSLDYSVKQVAKNFIAQGCNVTVRADLCTHIASLEDIQKDYERENIPFVNKIAPELTEKWQTLDKGKYVLIQKIFTDEASEEGSKLVEKIISLSADAVRGRFITNPQVNGKNIEFDIPDEEYKKAMEILKLHYKKSFGFTPNYEWGKTNFEKLQNFVRYPIAPQLTVFEATVSSVAPIIENFLEFCRDENKILDLLLERFFGITTNTTIRKNFFTNPYSIFPYIILKNLGFKDQNVIRDIIENEPKYTTSLWGVSSKI